jgi:hypothetical protein
MNDEEREKEDIRQKADSRDDGKEDREDEEMNAEMDEGHENGEKSLEQRPLPPIPKNLLPWEQIGNDIETCANHNVGSCQQLKGF